MQISSSNAVARRLRFSKMPRDAAFLSLSRQQLRISAETGTRWLISCCKAQQKQLTRDAVFPHRPQFCTSK
jgi:hypothetical protein